MYKLQYPTKAIQSHHRRTWISCLRGHPEKQQVPAANTQTPLPQGHPWEAQTSPRWASRTLRSHRFQAGLVQNTASSLPLLLSAFSYGLHAPFFKRLRTYRLNLEVVSILPFQNSGGSGCLRTNWLLR